MNHFYMTKNNQNFNDYTMKTTFLLNQSSSVGAMIHQYNQNSRSVINKSPIPLSKKNSTTNAMKFPPPNHIVVIPGQKYSSIMNYNLEKIS